MVEIPVRIRVTHDLAAGAEKVDTLQKEANTAWVSATSDAVDYIHEFADAEIRRITGGGNYWHMEKHTDVTGPGSASGYVKTDPSPRHPIAAKPGSALAFFWEKVGQDVVFQSVDHPGSNPVDWVSAMPEGATHIPSIYRRKLQEAWRAQ